MNNLIFSGNAMVRVEGDDIMQFLTLSQGQMKFHLKGLDNRIITLLDNRTVNLWAVKRLFLSRQSTQYYHNINAPAQVSVHSNPEGDIRVELRDTFDANPLYKLMISISNQNPTSIRSYLFYRVIPLTDKQHILLALSQRMIPLPKLTPSIASPIAC